MAKVTVVLVCGLPAAGKTTLCRALVSSTSDDSILLPFDFCEKEYPVNLDVQEACNASPHLIEGKNSLCYIHVSYDELIPRNEQEKYASLAQTSSTGDTLDGFGTESQWKKARQCVVEKVEQLVLILTNENLNLSLARARFQEIFHYTLPVSPSEMKSYVILVDDNFYYKSMRQEYYSLCERNRVGFCVIFVCSSVEDAIQRNMLRGKEDKVPREVIEQMARKCDFDYSELNDEKCFSVVLKFCSDSSRCLKTKATLESVFHRSLATPVDNSGKILIRDLKEKEAAESREICSKSILHQADNLLKKLVSEAVHRFRTGTYECQANVDVKVFVKAANDVRVTVREKLKQGCMAIPSCDASLGLDSNDILQKKLAEVFTCDFTERLQHV